MMSSRFSSVLPDLYQGFAVISNQESPELSVALTSLLSHLEPQSHFLQLESLQVTKHSL